jgi:hypothetical protein
MKALRVSQEGLTFVFSFIFQCWVCVWPHNNS